MNPRTMGVLLLLAVLTAAGPAAGDDVVVDATTFNRDLDLLYAADRTPVTAMYRDRPLAEVLDDLADQADLPIRAEWRFLEQRDITPHVPITLQLGETSLADALERLRLQMSDSFHATRVTSHDGRLVVTSNDVGVDRLKVTASYDVRDLIHWPDAETWDAIHKRDKFDDAHDPNVAAYWNASDNLTDLIGTVTESVEPDGWIQMGGDRSSVRAHEGLLIVRADMRTHRAVGELLDMLRGRGGGRADLTIAVVDIPRANYRRALRRHRPNSPLLARALLDDDRAVIHYRMTSPIEAGRPLAVRVRRETIDLSMRIDAQPGDEQMLLLDVDLELTTARGGEEQIATTVRWPQRRDIAVFELGAAAELAGVAGPERIARLVILKPQFDVIAERSSRPTRMQPGEPQSASH